MTDMLNPAPATWFSKSARARLQAAILAELVRGVHGELIEPWRCGRRRLRAWHANVEIRAGTALTAGPRCPYDKIIGPLLRTGASPSSRISNRGGRMIVPTGAADGSRSRSHEGRAA